MSPTDSVSKPLFNNNLPLQDYYAALESRIGYQLILGGTRHFGYWKKDTYWPFPITVALRAMEDHLYGLLGLEYGSTVLDAGCGVGHVALHLASKGLKIQAIDVVDRHIRRAQSNIKIRGMEGAVRARKMDYHHLDGFEKDTFDGIYTMETFVHATDPELAASEFYRVTRPGGKIALFEYEHAEVDAQPKAIKDSWTTINKYAAMPAHETFKYGTMKKILEGVGFEDVQYEDLTLNVTPMVRLFYLLAFIPYLFVRFFGLEKWFVNTVAGYRGYKSRCYSRYVAVTGRKPVADRELRKR